MKLHLICFTLIICLILPPFCTYAQNIDALEISSPTVALIDAKTGIVIYDKNMNIESYPASITKVMTALLTLEKYENNLDERILFSYESVFSLPYGSSHIAMNENETLSVEQALYGLMLESANEVANALAEDISGSVEDFGKTMTERAKELGAMNTNFKNPHGLHDEEHYSTAYDMALIMREAVKHPMFVELISSRSYEIPPTERQSETRYLYNSNKMIFPTSQFYNENVVGSKTGYTNESQHTLVSYGEKDDIGLIAVIMHGEKSAPYADTTALFNYGFTQYEKTKLLDKSSFSHMLTVMQEDTELGQVEVIAENDIIMLLPKNAAEKLDTKINLPSPATAPINAGDKMGMIEYWSNRDKIAESPLIAKSSVFALEPSVLVSGKISKSQDSFEEPEPNNHFFSGTTAIVLVVILIIFAISKTKKTHHKYGVRKYRNVYSMRNYKYKND